MRGEGLCLLGLGNGNGERVTVSGLFRSQGRCDDTVSQFDVYLLDHGTSKRKKDVLGRLVD